MITKIEELIAENTPESARKILGLFITTIDHDFIETPDNIRDLNHATTNPIDGLVLDIVDQINGDEGGGEMVVWVYGIFKDATFEDMKWYQKRISGTPLAYIEVTGSYSSYNGINWDEEAKFVYPREVMVTQYHATKV